MQLANTSADKNLKTPAFIVYLLVLGYLFFPWGFISPALTGGGAFFEYKGISYLLILLSLLVFLFQFPEFESKKTSIAFPVILLTVATALSLYRQANYSRTTEFVIYFCCLVGIGFLSTFFSYEELQKITIYRMLVLLALLLCLYGFFQVFMIYPENERMFLEQGLKPPTENRLTSVLTTPAGFASILILFWPSLYYFILWEKNSLWKAIGGITLIAVLAALILTRSKTALIIFLIQLLFMSQFIFRIHRKEFRPFLYFLGAIGGLGIAGVAGGWLGGDFFSSFSTSLAGRLSIWKTAVNMFVSNPLTGFGANAFSSGYFLYQSDGFFSQNAHNTFIQLFAETGILGGLAVTAAALYVVIKCCFFNFRFDLSKFLGFGILGFIIFNNFDSLMYVPLIGYFFGTLFGIAYSEVETPLIRNRDFPRNAFITAFIIFFVLSIFVNLAYYLETAGLSRVFRGDEVGLDYLRYAVVLNPVNPDYHRNLAQAYSVFPGSSSTNRINRIIETRKAIFLDRYNPDLYMDIAFYYLDEGQEQLSLHFMKKAAELAPKQPFYYFNIGRFYYDRSDLRSAKDYLEKAVAQRIYYRKPYIMQSYRPAGQISEIDPYLNIAYSYYLLGNISLTEGHEDKALKYYTEALSLYPDYADVYAALSGIELRHGQLQPAFDYIQKALSINSRNSYYWYLLGQIYYQSGDRQNALMALENSLRLNPNDVQALHLYNSIKGGDQADEGDGD